MNRFPNTAGPITPRPEFEIPRYLKTSLRGGIGDCLKHISCNFPLPSLYKEYGTQVFMTYEGWGVNSDREEAAIDRQKLKSLRETTSPWGDIIHKHIFHPSDFIIPVDIPTFNALNHQTVNEFFDTYGVEVDRFLTPFLPLDSSIKSRFVVSPKDRNIAIQLDSNEGVKKLKWSTWKRLINAILKKYQHTNIYLIDAPSNHRKIEDFFMDEKSRVFNTAGSSLSESISLISQMDLLISPDSFSKYVALCSRVPAIILCCELDYISPSRMLRDCFLKEMVYNDNYKLLGVEVEDDFNVKHIVKNVNDISVEEIIKYI